MAVFITNSGKNFVDTKL